MASFLVEIKHAKLSILARLQNSILLKLIFASAPGNGFTSPAPPCQITTPSITSTTSNLKPRSSQR